MRVISFCADGVKDAAGHGFYDWALQQDADIICIQGLQCQESSLTDQPFFPDGYYAYFLDAADGSNGVAIYTRQLPKAIMTGLGLGEADSEARYIQADFADLSICSLLVPPSALDQDGKTAFLHQLSATLEKVRKKRRQYVLCGNWDIAHRAADLHGAESADLQESCQESEQLWLDTLFGLGYVDAFRTVNSDEDEFSWWPAGRDGAAALRVDYQIVSASLRPSIEYGAYFKKHNFSSHAPLVMDYDLELRGL